VAGRKSADVEHAGIMLYVGLAFIPARFGRFAEYSRNYMIIDELVLSRYSGFGFGFSYCINLMRNPM
jgi:hypothetical protein